MSNESSRAPATSRCPGCRAAVRPDAPWCTQCWASLRSEPAPPLAVVAPAPRQAPDGPPAGPGRGVRRAGEVAAPPPVRLLGPGDEPAWPCTTCGTVNALEQTSCTACGAAFLAALREGREPLLVLPLVGDLAALPRAQRLGLAAALVLVVVLVVAVLGLALP